MLKVTFLTSMRRIKKGALAKAESPLGRNCPGGNRGGARNVALREEEPIARLQITLLSVN